MHERIDFIVTWVDGGDPYWQSEKERWGGVKQRHNSVVGQWWDDSLLRYWFRGVDKFAPWVHKVYLVTCGQQPAWLNTKCEKPECINHSDYMSPDSLPIFNSNAIEIGIHRIKGLSDYFVLFNDDMYIIDSMMETDFFMNGLPCGFAALDTLMPQNDFDITRANNISIINRFLTSKKHLMRVGKSGIVKRMLRLPCVHSFWTNCGEISQDLGTIMFQLHIEKVILPKYGAKYQSF